LRLLLDTHIWLWTLSDPKRAKGSAATEKRSQRTLALTLHYEGRFEIDENLTEWLARATAGTREGPLTQPRFIK